MRLTPSPPPPGKWRTMTNKNDAAGVISGPLNAAAAEKAAGLPGTYYQPKPIPAQQYMYFTETDTDRILDNLDGLRDTVFPQSIHIEDNVLRFPSGTIRAIAIRSWDPAAKAWAIWWLASNDPHRMDVPVVGRFENGDGTFLAEDSLNGRPILTRFLWLNTRTETPRWEQAMSVDGGASWETNWTMDFTRA